MFYSTAFLEFLLISINFLLFFVWLFGTWVIAVVITMVLYFLLIVFLWRIILFLKSFGLKANIMDKKEGYILVIPSDQFMLFRSIVAPHIIGSMLY